MQRYEKTIGRVLATALTVATVAVVVIMVVVAVGLFSQPASGPARAVQVVWSVLLLAIAVHNLRALHRRRLTTWAPRGMPPMGGGWQAVDR
ncbi:hypothetical protein [Angustibacter aerolatus]|uniref:Uncharacterized protein n=1 Tax=Angustibacter aerolatus TaxID=1162965 RepID=A0ABQ6JH04_9ACTN|nr:hypothetical protein [Angustibacter aerolatus]GMA87506.1 hypothetical protein GCM10025868_27560 [Angustibacter aerolatus]